MSDVKRWYVSPRTIELFLRAENERLTGSPSVPRQ